MHKTSDFFFGLFFFAGLIFCVLFLPTSNLTSLHYPRHQPSLHSPRGKVVKIFNSTGLVAVARACSDKAVWLQPSQHAPGCVCERTGQAETKEQLCQYRRNGKNKHLCLSCFSSFFFPLNSSPPVHLPAVCRKWSQTNFFSCKYPSVFPPPSVWLQNGP